MNFSIFAFLNPKVNLSIDLFSPIYHIFNIFVVLQYSDINERYTRNLRTTFSLTLAQLLKFMFGEHFYCGTADIHV